MTGRIGLAHRARLGAPSAALCLVALLGLGLLVMSRHPAQGSRTVLVSGWTFPALVDGRAGRAWVPGPDSIQVVDTRGGVLLRTVRIPGAMMPPEMQLDEGADRVLVRTHQATGSGTGDAVHLLDARSGQILGRLPLPPSTSISQVAVVERTRRIFILTQTRRVYTYDTRTGRRLAVTALRIGSRMLPPAPANPADTLVVDQRTGQVVVTASVRATLFALNGASGRVLWTATLHAHARQRAPVLWLPVIDEATGHLVVDDTSTGTVHALDLRTGRFARQTVHVNPGRVDMVAVARTNRAFVFYGGRVSVLNATTSHLVQTVRLGQTYDLGPAAVIQRAKRVLVVNNRTRTLDLLDGTTGRLVRALSLWPWSIPTVDDHAGRVLLTTNNGAITVVDARTGQIVRSIAIPSYAGGHGAATTLSVDASTGEIIALTYPGTPPSDMWAWIPQSLRKLIPGLLPPPTTSQANTSISVVIPGK